VRKLGRYALHDEIASGGMATVYLAQQYGEEGFTRVVAVKVLHAQYAKEEAFRAMFLDEARIVSRIRHPNVVATLDVTQHAGELFLVMDYVHGEALSRLLRSLASSHGVVPTPIALAVAIDTLEGIHAAHEATAEDGAPLGIVHRDVSPQNLIVGVDGAAHVADFGIAKAVGRLAEKFSVQHTVKGKAGYMAPEQLRGKVDRRGDLFSVGVVLWEMLAMQRLFSGDSFLEIVAKMMDAEIPALRTVRPDASDALEAVVARALERDPANRFSSAREMAVALEACGPRASAREVGEWVRTIARESLDRRAAQIASIERGEAPDPSGPPDDAVDIEIDRSVSGVAPGHVGDAAGAGALLSRSWLLGWVAVAALVAVVGASVAFTVRGKTPDVAAAGPPRDTAAPAAIASATVSSSAAAAPAAVETAARSSTPVVRHLRAPAVHHAPPATSCHWEQLPDDQGILIPKKICP
jgi:serine/threonine-protein kinase